MLTRLDNYVEFGRIRVDSGITLHWKMKRGLSFYDWSKYHLIETGWT